MRPKHSVCFPFLDLPSQRYDCRQSLKENKVYMFTEDETYCLAWISNAHIMWIVYNFKKNFTNICLLQKFWKIQKKYKDVEKKHPHRVNRGYHYLPFTWALLYILLLPWYQDLVTLYTMNISISN